MDFTKEIGGVLFDGYWKGGANVQIALFMIEGGNRVENRRLNTVYFFESP